MKAEFDKEMDSLLRERARRGRAASGERVARVSGGSVPPAAHLDADEQGAYAENALPAAARAHYTAHLADCDDCRRSVTRLALALGTAAQLEPRETATGQTVSPNITWRERLGALFAPRAWRYAVPALVLLLVSAISLIVLTRRTQREATETSVARSNTAEAQRPQAAQPQAQPEAHHAPNDNAAIAEMREPSAPGEAGSNASAPNPNAPQTREEIAANSPRGEVAQPVMGTVAPPPPAANAPAAASGTAARAVEGWPMPEATPASVADNVTVTSEQDAKNSGGGRAAELAKLERKQGDIENRQYDNRQRDQISGPRRNEQARNSRSTADADDASNRGDKQNETFVMNLPPPSPAATAAKRTRQREADRGKDEKPLAEDSERGEKARAASAAETRTVAGRKFRRQGDAWIDTAYNTGQSYTVVRRNSEQFRALVADEPELRRIAGALGGEVTVVWKGRAYRIR